MDLRGVGRNASFRNLRRFQPIQSLLSLAGVQLPLNFVQAFTNFSRISQLCAAWLKTAVIYLIIPQLHRVDVIGTQPVRNDHTAVFNQAAQSCEIRLKFVKA
jgi:hypothetical protein